MHVLEARPRKERHERVAAFVASCRRVSRACTSGVSAVANPLLAILVVAPDPSSLVTQVAQGRSTQVALMDAQAARRRLSKLLAAAVTLAGDSQPLAPANCVL